MAYNLQAKTAGAWGNEIYMWTTGTEWVMEMQANFRDGQDTAWNLAMAISSLISGTLPDLLSFIATDATHVSIDALVPGTIANSYGIETNSPARIELSGTTLEGGVDGVAAAFILDCVAEASAGDFLMIRRGLGEYTDIFGIDPNGRISTGGEKAIESTGLVFGALTIDGSAGLDITLHSGIITHVEPVL